MFITAHEILSVSADEQVKIIPKSFPFLSSTLKIRKEATESEMILQYQYATF